MTEPKTTFRVDMHLQLERIPVESSAISALWSGYGRHPDTGELVQVTGIEYKSTGRLYCYEDLPLPTEGESVGKWAHRETKAAGRSSFASFDIVGDTQ